LNILEYGGGVAMKWLLGIVFTASMILGPAASDPQAADYTWSGGSGTPGTWNTTTSNWNSGGATWSDGSGNNAYFNNAASTTAITLSGSRTAGSIQIGGTSNNGNANYTFTGGTLSATSFLVQGLAVRRLSTAAR
jgi:hypothetical protein